MEYFFSGLSVLLVVTGLLFFLGASIGILRFPDFYTRMHAAGKGDTLSTLLILAGVGVYQFHDGFGVGEIIVFLKILGICAFIMITSPTSTHALMEAGYEDGIEPLLGDDGENPLEPKSPLRKVKKPAAKKKASTKKAAVKKKAAAKKDKKEEKS